MRIELELCQQIVINRPNSAYIINFRYFFKYMLFISNVFAISNFVLYFILCKSSKRGQPTNSDDFSFAYQFLLLEQFYHPRIGNHYKPTLLFCLCQVITKDSPHIFLAFRLQQHHYGTPLATVYITNRNLSIVSL